MPYLNLDPNYPGHPKTRRLMGLLGDTADCYPVRLWSYCARFHPRDGRMIGYSAVEVESALEWRGESGKAVEALLKVEYLRAIENGYECVDWRQHEGHLTAFSKRGKAAAKARWAKYASSIPHASQSKAKSETSNPPSVPIRSGPDQVKKFGAFAPPTLAEVQAYCKERGNAVDAQRWHDFYSAKGWMVGKTRMRDWRAAVRTWERSEDALRSAAPPAPKVPGCRRCFGRPQVPGAIVCKDPECHWCFACDRDGRPSKKDPHDLIVAGEEIICKSCAGVEAVRA